VGGGEPLQTAPTCAAPLGRCSALPWRGAGQGYALHLPNGGAQVGVVCSGSPSPTLGTNIGTAYVQSAHAGAATLDMDIRGQRHPVKLQPLPFYQRAR